MDKAIPQTAIDHKSTVSDLGQVPVFVCGAIQIV